jgi:hypothetical protein
VAVLHHDFAAGIGDWTQVALTSGQTDPAWTAPVSTDQLQATSASSHNEALVWDDVDADGDRDDFDILCQVYVDSTSTTQRYLGGRISTSGASRTGYALRVRSNSLDTYRFTGSTYTAIENGTFSVSSGTWVWIRFRMVGTTIQAKGWTGAEADEPGSWICSQTDATYSTVGHVGCIKGANTNTQLWRHFNVGTNGDTATMPTSGQTVAIGQSTETDTAQAFTVTTTLAAAIGQASETDTAQALTPVTGGSPQTVGIGQAAESDTAQALTVSATRTAAIGQAEETDEAQAMSPVVGGATLIGQASETDAAQTLTAVPGVRTVAIGQASETDSAQAMSARAAATILAGMALEIDTAQPLTALISGASLVIGQASELDVAQALANVGGASSWTPGDGAMSPPRIGMARNGELWTLVINDDNVPTHAKRRGTTKLVRVHALPGGNQGQVMTATGVVLVVM